MTRSRVYEGLGLRSELSETQIFINSFYFKILKVINVYLDVNIMALRDCLKNYSCY